MQASIVIAIVLAAYLIVIMCALLYLHKRANDKASKLASDVEIKQPLLIPWSYELLHTQLPIIQEHNDITQSQFYFGENKTQKELDLQRNVPKIVLEDFWKVQQPFKNSAKKRVSSELQCNSSSQYKIEAFNDAFHVVEDVELKLFDGSDESYSSMFEPHSGELSPRSPRTKKVKKERISSLKKLKKKLSNKSSSFEEEEDSLTLAEALLSL